MDTYQEPDMTLGQAARILNFLTEVRSRLGKDGWVTCRKIAEHSATNVDVCRSVLWRLCNQGNVEKHWQPQLSSCVYRIRT
jgi:ribosomal protein S25